jgi:hypothetical protein
VSPRLHTAEDTQRERAVAEILARRWNAQIYHMGEFAPLDWYFERGGQVVAVAELKCRRVRWGTYPSIFLAHTKWCHLMFAYHYNDVDALFVVQSEDRLMYASADEIPAAPLLMLGRPARPGAPHDREPMLEVPLACFREVL